MNIYTPQAQAVILPILAIVYLIASAVSSHQEVKGHFSFFAKLIIGFCIGAFAADMIAFMANGRSTSFSTAGVSGYTSSSTSGIGISTTGVGSPGTMPWDGILSDLYQDLAKYVVVVVGGIAFIIGGIVFMYGVGTRAMRFGKGCQETEGSSAAFFAWKRDLDIVAISGESSSYISTKAAMVSNMVTSRLLRLAGRV